MLSYTLLARQRRGVEVGVGNVLLAFVVGGGGDDEAHPHPRVVDDLLQARPVRGPEGQALLDKVFGLLGPVSYTHLTLPTNHRV